MISCIKTDDDDDDDFNLLLETNILVGLKRIMTHTANLGIFLRIYSDIL